MKNKLILLSLLISCFMTGSCNSEDELVLDSPTPPGEVSVVAAVSEDGTGVVTFTAQASNTLVYHYYFGLGEGESPTVSYDGALTYTYRSSGDFFVRVVAYGEGGISSSTSTQIAVQVDFKPPADILQTLTNGTSRNWIWKQEEPAHLGVGPEFFDDGSPGDAPIWYAATPNEKEGDGCLYTDVITFSAVDESSVSLVLSNGGVTYFNREEVPDALGQPLIDSDACYDFETAGTFPVTFFQTGSGIANSTGIGIEINGGGFLSYFTGSSTYELLLVTEQELHVRVIQEVPGLRLAWYQKFIAEDAEMEVEEDNRVLVWADEFDTPGAPDPANWTYDLGDGCPNLCGWGNEEEQFYTDETDNVRVEDGMLKITAIRENRNGRPFTSARLKSQDLYEFTYGRIDVRARIPEGGGTWPAIWMLGADLETNPWPAAGEIDIMEHRGNDAGTIFGTVHSPSGFGGSANGGTLSVSDATTEFHVYTVDWTADKIDFLVDGQRYYTYNPATKDDDTYPFNKDFFLLVNLAMGGTFGGTIDSGVNEATLEVDYIRVYQ